MIVLLEHIKHALFYYPHMISHQTAIKIHIRNPHIIFIAFLYLYTQCAKLQHLVHYGIICINQITNKEVIIN